MYIYVYVGTSFSALYYLLQEKTANSVIELKIKQKCLEDQHKQILDEKEKLKVRSLLSWNISISSSCMVCVGTLSIIFSIE